ncbi:MAG: hypothetical protein IJ365_05120 [Clostridia bacterium]|nr:hypothetical protein [Clostridia bacterium]
MNNNNFVNTNKKITQQELERQISGIDRNAVEKKLRQMGMSDIADKLSKTSNEEIMRMLRNNPDVLKKLNKLMGGGAGGR